MNDQETRRRSDSTDVHPFFRFGEPTDLRKCLGDLRARLEAECLTFKVSSLQDGQPLRVQSVPGVIPRGNTSWAQNRAIRTLKTYGDDAQLVEDCSVVLAYLCGECTRPQINVTILFEQSDVLLNIDLPEFSQGDVGFRLWGASFLLSRHLMVMDNLKNKTIIELGAASGLCGLVAAKMFAGQVYLTDFNDACLAAASASSERNGFKNVRVKFIDWSVDLSPEIPWQNAVLIGAAVVYEVQHADLMTNFLKRAFALGAEVALIAIHVQHLGHDSFVDKCYKLFKVKVIDRRVVDEDLHSSEVILLELCG